MNGGKFLLWQRSWFSAGAGQCRLPYAVHVEPPRTRSPILIEHSCRNRASCSPCSPSPDSGPGPLQAPARLRMDLAQTPKLPPTQPAVEPHLENWLVFKFLSF